MASLTPTPKQQFFDANGNPLVAGKVYTYAGGTTTPIATYTDQAGTTANTNPIILDSRGMANIWLQPTVAYKFLITDSTDVTQYTTDNILVPVDDLSFSSPPPIGDVSPDTGAFTTLSATLDVTFSGTGYVQMPVGATTDRPGTPAEGMFRYNSTLDVFEGFSNSQWGQVGGAAGATGGGNDEVFIENDQTVTISYTIPATKNAMTTGPITLDAGFVGDGSIAGETLTIANVTSGAVGVGSVIVGSGITVGTVITALGDGTGGIGTYTVSPSQSASSVAITAPVVVTVSTGSRWVVL
ncbi:hypothetical protein UFOVP370_1 [uncultured Caudovirales phage]|uniref:Uncharacterized protein n=1 Tax=uncultured Caudovirales phage TaxID=2100421 RepID=A0A6J7WZS5_9CAUD|nr:hypothetical protein UFOVP370_1 [uncultured Caudovirales phage]